MNIINKQPDGFLQYPPEDVEEMKKIYKWEDREGTTLFPFHYLKLSHFERIYIPIKQQNKSRKKKYLNS
jgi:hypothetical protein